jgi:predicted type IV restriction endonuclease
MANIPKKVRDRLVAGIKRFQPILESAKARDVNESDTVLILTDILADVFGYDKYSQITSELAIRGTYCDLAIKIDTKVVVLVEAKAIGHELKDQHVKQAIDYAANKGVEWAVLSNGVHWRIYRVIFGRPVDMELLVDFQFLQLDPKDDAHLQLLYLLTLEGWTKSAIGDYQAQREALSRFCLGALMLSEPILASLRRELRRISPDVKIELEDISTVLTNEVIKREVIEGEKHEQAKKLVSRAANKALRTRSVESDLPTPTSIESTPATSVPAPIEKPAG